jgi:hypothetical protein
VQPIIVNERTGNVVGGHQRRKTLVAEGVDETDVVVVDLDVAEERALNVALNNQHISGEFTDDLDAMLEAIAADTPDLFEALRLDDLLDGLVQKVDPADGEDDVPEAPEVPTTITGDLWVMGDHRLLCGDSTSADDVARALGGRDVGLVFADPPYGISHSGAGISGAARAGAHGAIIGDESTDVACASVSLCLSEFPSAAHVFWGANYYPSILPDGYGWLVWDKQREGETFSGAEVAFVNAGVRVDVFRHQWHGMIKASEKGEARLHPTQKPVALVAECIARYAPASTALAIFDPFCGCGPTIIAAETSGRVCRGIDIDARYVDVAVTRWQRFTGGTATLDGDGRTFDEVKEGRGD